MPSPARARAVLVVATAVLLVLASVSACGSSGGSGPEGSATPVATVSPGTPVPSTLADDWVEYDYGFSFRLPSSFLVYEDPDYIERGDAVRTLSVEPDSATRAAYGLGDEHDAQLRILVSPVSPFYKDLDSEGTAQQMTTDIQDELSALTNLDATAVEPVDIDGFVGAQVAYSYDTDGGRRDVWRLTLTSPFTDYQLDIEAESSADAADRLEPAWTEIVNSLKTEQ